MARYEIDELDNRKFWEITLEGTQLTLRWGKVGGSSQKIAKRDLRDPAKAKKEVDKLVKAKLAGGYELVDDAPKKPTSNVKPAKPSPAPLVDERDPEVFLVEADRLQSEGSPLGEWIVLAHRLAKKPTAKLVESEQDLFDEHEELHDRAADTIRAARLAFSRPAKAAVRYRYVHTYTGWHRLSDVADDAAELKIDSKPLKNQCYPMTVAGLEYEEYFVDEHCMYEGIDLREHIAIHHGHWKISHVLHEGETVRLQWEAILDISVRLAGTLAKTSPKDKNLQRAIRSALYVLEMRVPALRVPGLVARVDCNEMEPHDDDIELVR